MNHISRIQKIRSGRFTKVCVYIYMRLCEVCVANGENLCLSLSQLFLAHYP